VTGLLRWCSGWPGDWLDNCQSDWLDDAMAQPARDRVTVDLRGLGDRVRSHAGAQQLSTGAFVRLAVLSQLKVGDLAAATELAEPAGPVVKVTLRLSDHHAALLARRARLADVSQGAYVAGLIDGTPPPPLPPDHSQTIAALVRSTDQLAVLGSDINGFLRALRSGHLDRLEPYRRSVMSLGDDVRQHLATAAALLKSLRTTRPARKRR
jgi:hypothetical protein